ncbi:MAG: ACP S-malonyltransferase [Gammaproteobacteria bacterium]|nr:ACP S-malonyltransferase [Gammaproteobacteria bacterium]
MKLAVVFPGQGSQSVGMLDDWRDRAVVKDTLNEASTTIDVNLDLLIHQGPVEQLNQTEFTQPAMLAAGIACWREWQQKSNVTPVWLAGHSLGEYAALVAAGAIGFVDAIKLVHLRGQLMQQAAGSDSGAMAAILGLDDTQVESICKNVSSAEAPVVAANYNAPGQIVISGAATAVKQCVNEAKTAGAKRALVLPVSVAAHSPLMTSAVEPLTSALHKITITEPTVPVWSFSGMLYASADDIVERLPQQLTAPVKWTNIVDNCVTQGATHLVECGPGKVLMGLNRRIGRQYTDRCFECSAVFDDKSVRQTIELMQINKSDNPTDKDNSHAQCA